MSVVSLKNVKVYATFSKGYRVVEESKGRDGRDYSQRWTVWSENHGLSEGDIVSLSGLLSAKVNEWTNADGELKHTVELSINSPKLDGFPAKSEPEAAAFPDDSSVPF